MDLEKERYLSTQEAMQFLGIKPSTFFKWKRVFEDFPKPYKISEKAVQYKVKELEEWMQKRRVNA